MSSIWKPFKFYVIDRQMEKLEELLAKISNLSLEDILAIVEEHKVLVAVVVALTAASAAAYWWYREEDPLTKRIKHILINKNFMEKVSNYVIDEMIAKEKINMLLPNHPLYRRISNIKDRILTKNEELPCISCMKRNWKLYVIDRPDMENAVALSNGSIVIYSGIINRTDNDDQIAVILAHEMSHVILDHNAEALSRALTFSLAWIVPSILAHNLLPAFGALLVEFVSSYLSQVLITLPFSRSLEREADVFGLELAARACFDIREALVFWRKMVAAERSGGIPTWMRGHPNHEDRLRELSLWVPKALELYKKSSCPTLPAKSAGQGDTERFRKSHRRKNSQTMAPIFYLSSETFLEPPGMPRIAPFAVNPHLFKPQ